MKALVASLATAVVLVGAAWAGNVTPGNLTALTHRVNQLKAELAGDEQTLACLKKGWNAQSTTAYRTDTWGGFDTKSGNVTFFEPPAPADGLSGSGYLITSAAPQPAC